MGLYLSISQNPIIFEPHPQVCSKRCTTRGTRAGLPRNTDLNLSPSHLPGYWVTLLPWLQKIPGGAIHLDHSVCTVVTSLITYLPMQRWNLPCKLENCIFNMSHFHSGAKIYSAGDETAIFWENLVNAMAVVVLVPVSPGHQQPQY